MPTDPPAAGHNPGPRVRSGRDVVCFGFLTHCLLLMVEELPPKNGGASVLDIVETVGDDAVIVACILSGWGVPATLVSSPVGDDHDGGKVLQHLSSRGLDVDHRFVRGLATPLETAIVDATGGRTYFQRRDAAILDRLTAPAFDEPAAAGLLYVDWYDGPAVVKAMENARSAGVPVFLNLESRYDRSAEASRLLRYASICQVSLDEPNASANPADVARSLIERGVGTALVTMGADGCVVARAQDARRVETPAVEVVDGFGAGAAYSAGIIYGLRAEWPLEKTARFATAYASLKCQVKGMAELPISEVQRVAANLEATPLVL